MVILVEGARTAGKSHLIKQFFEQNKQNNIIYYKFALSDWIKILNFEDHETGPGVHYFSISNIITILGISQTLLKDKHIVFDRSIYSAYVWSIFRRRMNEDRLIEEFKAYLNSDEYRNVAVIDILKSDDSPVERAKDDIFDKFQNYKEERAIYDRVFSKLMSLINDHDKNNSMYRMINHFDKESEHVFNDLLYSIVNK